MSQHQRTILIIEDCPEDLVLYHRYLRQDLPIDPPFTYQITEAHLGAEGIAKWHLLHPDLVILDYSLPDMDGLAVLRALQSQAQQRFLPVIMITGTGDEAIAVQAIKLGAQDYLTKGQLTAKKLCQVVHTTLEALEIRRELQSSQERERQAQAALRQAYDELEQRVEDRTADLRRANQDLHQISTALSHAVEGISQLDRQGHYVRVNQAYADAVGYQADEMIGLDWQRTVHPDDHDRMLLAYTKMQQTGKVEVEARGIRKDGSIFYKQLSMIAIANPQGEFLGHYCFMKDISERKQAEQQIQEQSALLNVASDAIFVCNLDDQILFWNQGAERLYGWQATAVLYQSATTLLCRNIVSQMQAAIAIVKQQGEWQGELQKLTQSGKSVTVSSRMTLIRDEMGNPKSILTVDTDITEKRLLESQFLRAQRLESLGTLASGIAHDFNNILTPILATAQLLQRKLPQADEQTLRLLKMQEESAKRGADLIQQILAFARGTESQRIPVQIGYLLTEIAKVVEGTFPQVIDLDNQIPSRDLWLILADSTQLHQVVMNLCVNARDAMLPLGGKLTLTAANLDVDEVYARSHLDAQAGPYIVISIADTGSGIAPEILDQIFDPFFTTKSAGQGTGLGLATVMSIVKKHGGFLTVTSTVGQGSCFKVHLPAINRSTPTVAPDQSLPLGNNEQILVIDDETPIREVTRTLLETHNYRVLTAANGIEAIALYTEHSTDYESAIDLVLTDLIMPTMSGELTIAVLHRLNPRLKIIAMSGRITRDRFQRLTDIEVTDFLPKPYTTTTLLKVVHQALANGVAREELINHEYSDASPPPGNTPHRQIPSR